MAHNSWLQRIRKTNQWKPAIEAYPACTALVDDLVGQIVAALEESPYADNTIIVLWSDHGFQLGEKGRWGKYSLWERATRVNLMWLVPDVTTPGTTSEKPVNLLDIYPTVASLTGCEPPEGQLEGNDLSTLMKDPKPTGTKPRSPYSATRTTVCDPNATATSPTPTEPRNSTITRATSGNGRISPIIRNTRR